MLSPECSQFSLGPAELGGGIPVQADANMDLAAIFVPGEIPNFHPAVFDRRSIPDATTLAQIRFGEGTGVYTIGYLLGEPGQHLNFPVTRFGTVSRITNELWYSAPPARPLHERAWIIEINAVPGLSGSPVLLREIQTFLDNQGHLQTMVAQPVIVGLLKGTLTSSIGPQELAAIEPYDSIAVLITHIYTF
jgi:hypothetical protein